MPNRRSRNRIEVPYEERSVSDADPRCQYRVSPTTFRTILRSGEKQTTLYFEIVRGQFRNRIGAYAAFAAPSIGFELWYRIQDYSGCIVRYTEQDFVAESKIQASILE